MAASFDRLDSTLFHPKLEPLIQRLVASVPKEHAQFIENFTQQYYAVTPQNELDQRNIDDLYGATLACWGFIQHRTETGKVRIFNPDFEEHGWQSIHSVIEIIHVDMPFLIDSIRMELNRRNIAIHFINHTVIPIRRDAKGKIQPQHYKGKSTLENESIVYIEVDRHANDNAYTEIKKSLENILNEIGIAVNDYENIKCQARESIEWIQSVSTICKDNIEEGVAFIQWILANNFTFLGCQDFTISTQHNEKFITREESTKLGIFNHEVLSNTTVPLTELPESVQALLLSPQLILITKSSKRSRIHRPAYPDYITIKKVNKKGDIIGGRRFSGLFTQSVYTQNPFHIPIVRLKVQQVIDESGLNIDSHSGKQLQQILIQYPSDELFHTDTEQLSKNVIGILNIQERRLTQIFLRSDPLHKFLSCQVYMPRDLYNTELRIKIQNLLEQTYSPESVEFTTFFSESTLARTLFTLKLDPAFKGNFEDQYLEADIQAVVRSWQDDLKAALNENVGEERGNQLFQYYRHAFGASYREEFNCRTAVVDIQHICSIKNDDDIAMSLYRNVSDNGNSFKFKLYNPNHLLPLSDIIPILENLGLRVMGEHPYCITLCNKKQYWIHDFSLVYTFSDKIKLHERKDQFHCAFRAIWNGQAENDQFNKLLLGAGISWREVALLRAYARYMKQIRFGFSEAFIAETLFKYSGLTYFIINYFNVRFNPSLTVKKINYQLKLLDQKFSNELEQVESINDDKIFHRYHELIRATQRTNFFQLDNNKKLKGYFSFKLSPQNISDIPLPKPLFEIFVYSPRVEGVHLRGGKVARGGLRWSDRSEDYRTEVLSLVKAQQVKNSVIVPVGAKGGFVPKQLPEGDRDALLAEGIACYKIFISALLDITDNLLESIVRPPIQVVRHDDDDPYLVVAADKGTATFSDISNQIAQDRNFWLGDAFASGGSVGYDHKKMGITAKGAWVSVQRHFREQGINVQKEAIRIIAIGDMAGDVFGNGMLRSKHIQLVAAFNHMNIFIDPNPADINAAYNERKRLFDLPRSSWSDYDTLLISKGGGIFKRSAKTIPITAEMKIVFNIASDILSPNELIRALLKSPVDLIWNGGIGTYVKSSDETHADAGDKANDSLRINGCELQTKVIGEGGNLGITQRARIEFALAKQGSSYTDFIDNAAGVDCSDHEVNIKILLNGLVQSQDMTEKQRNKLLEDMTDEVSILVLSNNYRQTQAIAIAYRETQTRITEYKRLINDLEQQGKLNRELEFLPTDEELDERKVQHKGLTKPELSVLISYTKGDLKELLNSDNISNNNYLAKAIESAFPRVLTEKYSKQLYAHQLRSEIVATQLANEVVNRMGINFINRMQVSTGADVNAIIKSYVAARDVFGMDELWSDIEHLDFIVETNIQEQMMADLMRTVRRASRWFLRNRRKDIQLAEEVQRFKVKAACIGENLGSLLTGKGHELWQKQYEYLLENRVPKPLAAKLAGVNNMYNVLSIIEGGEQTNTEVEDVAATYYLAGQALDIEWFLEQLNKMPVHNHWQGLARETHRDDLDWQQRTLTVSIINSLPKGSVEERLEYWLSEHEPMIRRWHKTVTELQEGEITDFSVFTVALRELLDLAQACRIQTT